MKLHLAAFCLLLCGFASSARAGDVNLFPALPEDAIHADGIALPDGSWWVEAYLPEEGILVEGRRNFPLPAGAESVLRYIEKIWPEAENLKVAADSGLSEKLSYPAFRASFSTGDNEDFTFHEAAAVNLDDWTFWIDASATADALYDDESDSAPPTRKLDAVFRAIDFIPGDGAFVPDIGVPVIMPGDGAVGETGLLSVIDSIVRLKRAAYPEAEHGTEGVAYRYDGLGEPVRGRKARLFSFGADSPEKFTAERHFAVDGSGIVYEMDILAGGEYEPIVDGAPKYWDGDDVPNWWGEYRDGDKVLRILNFRAGPVHHYLVFSFEIAGEAVGDDLAVVGYDNVGSFCNLEFRLEPDGGAIRVERTAEPPCEGEEWTGRCEGVYRRAE